MVQQVTERKLNLFGHICRMMDNRLVKEMMFLYLYSASCSAHQSEVLPARDTPREESSLERMKRGTMAHQLKMGKKDCEGPCLSHRSPRSRDKEIMLIM